MMQDVSISEPKILQPAAANFFDGIIDEVKVYASALTPSQIAQDYNQGKSLVMGAVSTESDGKTPSYSKNRAYCIPGDTSTCNPPVMHWKFDEKKGRYAYDKSGNNYMITRDTANGAPETWVKGKFGSAVDYPAAGGGYDLASKVAIGNYYTISFWTKLPIPDTGDYHSALDADNNSSYVWLSSGKILGVYAPGHAWSTIDLDDYPQGWHQIVATGEGDGTASTTKFYIDGIYRGMARNIDPIGVQTVGASCYGTCQSWGAPMDEFMVYNYVRTPAQIAWDYNRGKPVGHWKLDEGQGSTAKDWSGPPAGGGKSGTLTNMSPATDWITGKFNKALDFDGVNDYITIADTSSSSLDVWNMGISITAWVKTNSGVCPGSFTYVVRKKEIRLMLNAFDSSCRMAGLVWSGGSVSVTNYAPGSISWNNTSWNHWAFTYDRGNLSLYRNGSQSCK